MNDPDRVDENGRPINVWEGQVGEGEGQGEGCVAEMCGIYAWEGQMDEKSR